MGASAMVTKSFIAALIGTLIGLAEAGCIGNIVMPELIEGCEKRTTRSDCLNGTSAYWGEGEL